MTHTKLTEWVLLPTGFKSLPFLIGSQNRYSDIDVYDYERRCQSPPNGKVYWKRLFSFQWEFFFSSSVWPHVTSKISDVFGFSIPHIKEAVVVEEIRED